MSIISYISIRCNCYHDSILVFVFVVLSRFLPFVVSSVVVSLIPLVTYDFDFVHVENSIVIGYIVVVRNEVEYHNHVNEQDHV